MSADSDPDVRRRISAALGGSPRRLAWLLVAVWLAPVAPIAAAEDAGALFATHCARCHGALGHGDGPDAETIDIPVPDLTDPGKQSHYDDASMEQLIAKGFPPMPPFGGALTPEQITALRRYIRSIRRVPAHEKARRDVPRTVDGLEPSTRP